MSAAVCDRASPPLSHPRSGSVLFEAYLQDDSVPNQWEQRKRLVHLIETLNVLPNAVARSWETEFSNRARSRMLELLSDA